MTFVGRGPQLAELNRLWRTATAGDGRTVLVLGEAGIGKTALVERIRATAASSGAAVLTGRCVPDEGAPPLWPWLRVLDDAARAGISGVRPELLQFSSGDDTFDPAPAARFRAFDRTSRTLVAAATPPGLLIVVEDLHWADDASLRLLQHLANEAPAGALLVVGTVRDPDAGAAIASTLAETAALPAVVALRLAGLDLAEIERYLRENVSGPIDPSWPEHLHDRCRGNPLYLRELVKVYQGLFARPAVEGPVPRELQRIIGARLGRLSAECRAVLGGCSVMGDEIDLTLLRAAVGSAPRSGPAWDDAFVAAAIAEAADAGILEEDPATPATLRFSHALVRLARYEELDRAERVWWHRRIADALEPATGSTGTGVGGESGVDDRTGELAWHRVRSAVDPESRRTAAGACVRAARTALRRLAFDDAVSWLRQSLDLATAATDEDRAEQLLELAEALYRAGRVAEALRCCATVADIGTRRDLPDLLARAATVISGVGGAEAATAVAGLCARARARLADETSARHARVLARHAQALANLEDRATALRVSRAAMAMAERVDDPAALIDAVHARHQAHGAIDADAAELATTMVDLAVRANRPDAALWGHLWHIDIALHHGEPATLDAETHALAAEVNRLGWPVARWHLLRVRATRAKIAGQFAEAEQLLLASRDVSRQVEDDTAEGLFLASVQDILRLTGRFDAYAAEFDALATAATLPVALSTLAMYRAYAGDASGAEALLDRVRPGLRTPAADPRRPAILATVGETAVILGDAESVRYCHDELLPFAGRYFYSVNSVVGAVARTLGVMAAALGRADAAVRLLDEAIELERRVGGVPFVAVAQLAQARVLLGRGAPGDRERALRHARAAGQTARRLGMAPTLAAVTGLVDELAGVTAGAAAGLTAREREITSMVASGMTNRAVAAALVLSERTVETHVRNILIKLGLANRTQLAAWAQQASFQ